MCILLFAVNPNPPSTGYKLVLAMNREEFYDRPTLPAHAWEEEPHIYGGMDVEPNRERGTWLAMNTRTGTVASLLNILYKHDSTKRRFQRRIVPDFLSRDPEDGVASFQKDVTAGGYKPFNFVSITNLKSTPIATCYSNISSEGPVNLPLKTDGSYTTYGMSNSLYSSPYKKTVHGVAAVDALLTSASSERQNEIVDGLLTIVKDTQRHVPDLEARVSADYFGVEGFFECLTSTFCNFKGECGTRTHTIILVRADNQADFLEWTMEQPIVDSYNPTWTHCSMSMPIS